MSRNTHENLLSTMMKAALSMTLFGHHVDLIGQPMFTKHFTADLHGPRNSHSDSSKVLSIESRTALPPPQAHEKPPFLQRCLFGQGSETSIQP